ncbi:hypothetical protein FHS35_008851 [Streptomyces umbrinus]|nr:hypothetical protein [Streptomyces umbrinus]
MLRPSSFMKCGLAQQVTDERHLHSRNYELSTFPTARSIATAPSVRIFSSDSACLP